MKKKRRNCVSLLLRIEKVHPKRGYWHKKNEMPRCEIALREKIIEGKKQTLTPWIMKT